MNAFSTIELYAPFPRQLKSTFFYNIVPETPFDDRLKAVNTSIIHVHVSSIRTDHSL